MYTRSGVQVCCTGRDGELQSGGGETKPTWRSQLTARASAPAFDRRGFARKHALGWWFRC